MLAGDISLGTEAVELAGRWFGRQPVLFVAGNYEHYRHPLPGLTGELRAAATGSAAHVLENDELLLGSVRFLGCTLWSDFMAGGADELERSMMDLRAHAPGGQPRGRRSPAAQQSARICAPAVPAFDAARRRPRLITRPAAPVSPPKGRLPLPYGAESAAANRPGHRLSRPSSCGEPRIQIRPPGTRTERPDCRLPAVASP